MTNRTQETIRCYIFTMNSNKNEARVQKHFRFTSEIFRKVIKEKNSDNEVIKVDVTDLYEKEFKTVKMRSILHTIYIAKTIGR